MAIEHYYPQDQQATIPEALREHYALGTIHGVEGEVFVLQGQRAGQTFAVEDATGLKTAKGTVESERNELRQRRDTLTGENETLNDKVTTQQVRIDELQAKRPADFKKLQADLDEARTEHVKLTEERDQTAKGRLDDFTDFTLRDAIVRGGGTPKLHLGYFQAQVASAVDDRGKPVLRVVDSDGKDRTKTDDSGKSVPMGLDDLIAEGKKDPEIGDSFKGYVPAPGEPPRIPGAPSLQNGATSTEALVEQHLMD